jgi:hypothetical protein
VFCDAAVTKVQLLYVFEGLSWLVVWLEGFLESFHKLLILSLVQFIGLRFFALFYLCLNKLLFPNSSVSFCQIGQNEGYLLLVVVIYESVYFEVNINILHEQDKIASFPCKGFQWVKLDIFRGFQCRGCNISGIVSSIFQASFLLCYQCRGISVSKYCSVKVSGCAVKIQAHSLVSLHFC